MLSKTMAYLEAIFPGQALIPVIKAGACIGYAPQTSRNKIVAGDFPLPNFLVGSKRVVRKLDLADYLDSLGPQSVKRGRKPKVRPLPQESLPLTEGGK